MRCESITGSAEGGVLYVRMYHPLQDEAEGRHTASGHVRAKCSSSNRRTELDALFSLPVLFSHLWRNTLFTKTSTAKGPRFASRYLVVHQRSNKCRPSRLQCFVNEFQIVEHVTRKQSQSISLARMDGLSLKNLVFFDKPKVYTERMRIEALTK